MRVLVTGCNGQLGNEMRRCLNSMKAEIGPIPASYQNADVDYVDYQELNISDKLAVERWFSKRAYDLVINCAAYTNVDGCEIDESSAYEANALGPKYLAAASEAQGAKLVHISTDYVFSGDEPEPRTENDPTGPISAYGRTKLAGEVFVAEGSSRSFICRTAWLYGYVGKNFVKTMRRLGAERDSVMVVADQLGNPTSANDLAYEILKIATTESYGIYHITGQGTCSWAEFAARIMAVSRLDCDVVPVTSEEYRALNPQSAERPRYSSLSNMHLAKTIGDEMRPWQVALDEYIGNLPKLEG